MPRLLQRSETEWETVQEFSTPAPSYMAMDSTEFGLVVMTTNGNFLLGETESVELAGCSGGFHAISYMGDLVIPGIADRYEYYPCVFGLMTETETELLLEPARPQPGMPLVVNVRVSSSASAPLGVVGVDGRPAGSCTIEALTPISATTSTGTCELNYNRDIEVELIASYYGSALSGGDGWQESWSASTQVQVTAGIFSNSFE